MMEEKALDRRAFLMGTALAGTGTLLASLWAGCANENATTGSSANNNTGKNSETDLIVVGSGLAGITAALSAADKGAKVIIIEKRGEDQAGGNSRTAGGGYCMPSEDTPEAIELYYQDCMDKSSQRADSALLRKLAENAWSGYRWLLEKDCELLDPVEQKPYHAVVATAAPAMYQGMPILLENLQAKLANAGGQMLYNTKFLDLVNDETNGRVIGVKVRTAEGTKEIIAKGVILAGGGYAANKLLLEQFIGEDADESVVRGNSFITGDVFAPAQKVGAQLVQMGGLNSVHVAAVNPENPSSANPGNGVAYSVAINSQGERFVDESQGYVVHGKAVMSQPGSQDALVFDSKIAEEPLVKSGVIDNFKNLDIPVITADTLEELASKINVPTDAFVMTIGEFNSHVNSDGTTSGLAVNKSAMANKIENPPYYACWPLKPGITLTFGGLSINDKAQVLEADGTAIPGLYAAGECAGGFFVYDYVGATSIPRSVVFGRIAAETAVAELSQ
jgi:flavocytochrome c